ncbi:MAG TPA: M20/M25/M40 family metallo-hydrolase [Vicinamibacteria bacterium]
MRDARRLLRPLRAEIVGLAQALVRVDTVAIPPDGHETAGQRVLRAHLKPYSLDVEMYDCGFLERSRHPNARRDRRYRGRHNLIARLHGTGGGRSLLLSGHMDTVPTRPNPWRESPWSGSIRGGRLHGRGSWDMKSGLAAQFAVAMALRKAGVRLPGDLLCESVIDEEFAGGGGMLAGRLRGDNADACAIAEGTNHEVVRATRGGHFFDLVCRAGDPMAYFSKAEVVSPALPMGRILGWIDGWVARRRKVDRGATYAHFEDPAPVQVLALEANRCDPDVPWSVPLEARVRVYFQFLPHEDVPAVVREIEGSLAAFCRRDPFFRAHPVRIERLVDPPLLGHELAADHPWTACLWGAASGVVGAEARLSASEWPCDAFIAQRHFGIPTLLFGPKGAGSHNANEYVLIASVLRTAEVYLAAALEWCARRRVIRPRRRASG